MTRLIAALVGRFVAITVPALSLVGDGFSSQTASKMLSSCNSTVYADYYRGAGEVDTIEVLDRAKLIDDIHCVVIRDWVYKDGQLVEDTDDGAALGMNGDLFCCAEEVKHYETCKGKRPPCPELVSVDGSFKRDRDHDCVVTREWSLLQPGQFAYKYYARDGGLLLKTRPDAGEVIQLVGCNFSLLCSQP